MRCFKTIIFALVLGVGTASATQHPAIVLKPNHGVTGVKVHVTGKNFAPAHRVVLRFAGKRVKVFKTNRLGRFSVFFRVRSPSVGRKFVTANSARKAFLLQRRSPVPVPVPPCPTPSGVGLPTGDIPGWHQVFTDDFTTDVALGSFPSTVASKWGGSYPDGWKDTTGHGIYTPSKVVSVGCGVMNLNLHTENGVHMVAAPVPTLPKPMQYGRYVIRFRSDSMPGYKTAWLLWPDSGVWPRDGEIDFPEGNLNDVIKGFVHHQGASSPTDQAAFSTTTTYTDWHTAVIEWTPGRVNFLLDGTSIGTTTERIPNTPMHWVIQTETSTDGTIPATTTNGNVQIDWVAAYAPVVTPPPVTDPVIMAVGDTTASATNSNDIAVKDLVASQSPSNMLFLGDYQYTYGSLSAILAGADQIWGPKPSGLWPIIRPTAGPTHDVTSCTDGNYQSYWGVSPILPYSFDLGTWHIISLPSAAYRYGCDTAGILAWLNADLATHTNTCTLAFWHEPYWTRPTATHTSDALVKPWVDALIAAHADVILNGHQHDYQRILDPSGVREFIVGTGGIGLYPFTGTAANVEASNADTFGALRMVLHPGGYDFNFMRAAGGTFTDSGTGICR